jgi:hypothetical protein
MHMNQLTATAKPDERNCRHRPEMVGSCQPALWECMGTQVLKVSAAVALALRIYIWDSYCM